MNVDTTLEPRSPRALLLDFGSVISTSLFECHRDTERQLGLESGLLQWRGPIAPEADPLWRSMLRQEIGEREYWALRAEELGAAVGERGWTTATMLARLRHNDPNRVVRPQIARLVTAARARGLRLGILSNELELFYGPKFMTGMDVMRSFDVVVDATHTGILKPDARAYALAAEALEVEAGDVLFVDDQFRNVAGGFEAGMQVQHFDLRDVPGSIAAVAARLAIPAKEWA